MIPLRDVIPSRTFPLFTIVFIVLNSLAFLFEQSLPGRTLEQFIHAYGVVPARFAVLTVFTSMFLHAGWGHFLGNMLFLWIFGDNVEDRLGHVRFVVFYFMCGVAAIAAHVYMNPWSTIPTVGASGAIAGYSARTSSFIPIRGYLRWSRCSSFLKSSRFPRFCFSVSGSSCSSFTSAWRRCGREPRAEA